MARESCQAYLLSEHANVARHHNTQYLVAWARRDANGQCYVLHAEVLLFTLECAVQAVEHVWVCAAQRELAHLGVLDPKVLPVQKGREPFNAVPLVDLLTPRLRAEGEHAVRQVVDLVFG